MTTQARSTLEPASADRHLPPLDEALTNAGVGDGGKVPPDEAETLRLCQGFLVGAALSLCGFWGPLALMAWWWFR